MRSVAIAAGAVLAVNVTVLVWLNAVGIGRGYVPAGFVLAAAAATWAMVRVGPTDGDSPMDERWLRAGFMISGGVSAALSLGFELWRPGDFDVTQRVVLVVGALFVILSGPLAARAVRSWDGRMASSRYGILEVPEDGPLTTPTAPLTRLELGVLGLIVAATVIGVATLVSDSPLGHDESVYAVKARAWHEGTPSSGFYHYRPVGMAAVGYVIYQFDQSESAFRLFGLVSTVAMVGVVWLLGRVALRPGAGLLAAAIFVVAPSVLRRAPEFLNDLASAALLIGVMILVYLHFEERTRRWTVLGIAPLAASAFYLRYGSAMGVILILAVAVVVWRRRLAAAWVPVAAACGLLALLITPHVLHSIERTGSVTGIVQRAAEAAGREYLGEGLVTYAGMFPERLAGMLGGVVMVLGLIGFGAHIVSAFRRGADTETRAVLFVGTVAVLWIITNGIFVHAEERYVFGPTALLLLLGGNLVMAGMRHLTFRQRHAVAILLALTVSAALVVGIHHRRTGIESATDGVVVAAARWIAADADGKCLAITSYQPQITWYSRCASDTFAGVRVEPDKLERVDYVIVFENGKRQPDAEAINQLVGGRQPAANIPDPARRIGDASIYAIRRGP